MLKKNFEKYLAHYQGKPSLRFLQIGTFIGNASLWMLHNVLTNPSSLLIDVDTWTGSNELSDFDWNLVESSYDEKISKYNNVIKYKTPSQVFLQTVKNINYDFVYVDGDHTASAVFQDASLAWNYLKPNGIIAFDDYLWRNETDDITQYPKLGIDMFLHSIHKQFTALENSYQVWIQKI